MPKSPTNFWCSGPGPHAPGEVRCVPVHASNYLADWFCAACFAREMAWRRARNAEAPGPFAVLEWAACDRLVGVE